MKPWMRTGLCLWGLLGVACGSAGGSGAAGQDGQDGQNGKSSLIRFVAEPAGANCQQGGTAVLSGLDTNGNGSLEDTEVKSKAYACNGSSGQENSRSLVRTDPEPAGSHCAQGGTLVSGGVDANNSGTLEPSEVTSTAYVCSGAAGNSGAPGAQALVRLDAEPPGTRCAQGGTAVRSGLDANGNGTLETAEVTQTQYVCTTVSAEATKWVASEPAPDTGEVSVATWLPSGRKVRIAKTSQASRLKITVSDGFRTGGGVNAGYGYYVVRMNGGYMSPYCYQGQYSGNASGWTNEYYYPFATVCLTDMLPVGVYEFETWVLASVGIAHVGAAVNLPLLFAEEVPATARYGLSQVGGVFATTSSTYQKAPNREVVYTKQAASTLLKVTLADTFRGGATQNGSHGNVMVRMDGTDTTCYTGKYDAQGTGGDFHDPFVMTCMLLSVPAGTHTFNVWINSVTAGQVYLGWERGSSVLMIEELDNQNLSFSNGSIPSGELSSNWAAVGGRQVQHTVSATGKALRVTFSDTFRSSANCKGYWGYLQLYVDGQPTGCINGQYTLNSGAGQDHHHAVNQVCIVRNLSAGAHTFSIWTTNRQQADGTFCGSNHFGWNRGQNLLLVEELP
jgi:hypothetical protein